ncbi:MAG: TonB-dependent receptor [Bacteroidales bacterium]
MNSTALTQRNPLEAGFCSLRSCFFLLLLSFLWITGVAQEKQYARIKGKITGPGGEPLELVNISLQGMPGGTVTNADGEFQLTVPANKRLELVITFVGYRTEREELMLKPGEIKVINLKMSYVASELQGVMIEDQQIRGTTLTRINPKIAAVLPGVGGGIESIIKTMPGVSSNNELSSQYSVRGGNFDENLVYVNDVEIYRPFLIRSGQQEGLSFLNPDLVSSILFSAGGFEARYGDKMSSVLDIQYRRPTSFGGSASLSLLGASLQLEGVSSDRKTTWLLGLRQKSNQYLLGSLQTKADYQPSFTDIQTYITRKLSPRLELAFLGNYSHNLFRMVPHDRETSFGTLQQAYRLRVYFEGQEDDKFHNGTGALTLAYKPHERLSLRFITSAFRSRESENYDILGQYWIGELENDQSVNANQRVVEERGVGSYLNHARNRLDATVVALEHKGTFLLPGDQTLNWGLKFQHEAIDDKISEWSLIDSAGYALPLTRDSAGYILPSVQPPLTLPVTAKVKATNNTRSERISGYIQRSWSWKSDSINYTFNVGVRAQYWSLNSQAIVSPRTMLSVKPAWKRDVVLRLAGGWYYQPPFYRELRDYSGIVHASVKAQKSVQVVAGADYNFKAWERPFKLVAELYYKNLSRLIPYDVDNVRIRYAATNDAHGYAAGLDLKVNGEFVPGVESWAGLSLMKSMEDIEDDFYWEYYNAEGQKIIPGFTTDVVAVDSVRIEPGYLPRPSDQRVNFNLFFQDYLPNNPTYKMHLNMVFGTGLPFGPPASPRYQHVFRTPPYRRVDIGFSKLIQSEAGSTRGFLRHFTSIWITAEVFNLLQFSNTVSYVWVTDINGRRYAIPNYLTPRMLNVKMMVNF